MAREDKKYRGVFEHPRKSGIWWISYFDQSGKGTAKSWNEVQGHYCVPTEEDRN